MTTGEVRSLVGAWLLGGDLFWLQYGGVAAAEKLIAVSSGGSFVDL